MNGVELRKLGTFSEMKYGKMPKKDRITEDGQYPIYSGYRIVGYYNEYNLEQPTLIVVARGVGGTGDVKISPAKCYLTNLSIYVDVDESVALKEYLYYYFQIHNLRYLDSGSAQSQITIADLKNVEVPIPTIETQDKVVSILKSLDNKIANNEAINRNLEEQSVLLFRSWFSSFSQSGGAPYKSSEFGDIPDDFTVVKIGNLPILITDYVANGSFASLKENVTLYQEPNYAYFVRNTDLKSGSFGVFVDKHSYEFLSKSTLYGGEIIISNVGDVGSVFLCPYLDGQMTLGNNIIMLRPEDNHLRYYLYIWFKYLLYISPQ